MLVSFVQAFTVWRKALEPCGSPMKSNHPKRRQLCPHYRFFNTNSPNLPNALNISFFTFMQFEYSCHLCPMCLARRTDLLFWSIA